MSREEKKLLSGFAVDACRVLFFQRVHTFLLPCCKDEVGWPGPLCPTQRVEETYLCATGARVSRTVKTQTSSDKDGGKGTLSDDIFYITDLGNCVCVRVCICVNIIVCRYWWCRFSFRNKVRLRNFIVLVYDLFFVSDWLLLLLRLLLCFFRDPLCIRRWICPMVVLNIDPLNRSMRDFGLYGAGGGGCGGSMPGTCSSRSGFNPTCTKNDLKNNVLLNWIKLK